MATQAQIQANRLNAQKSTGPRTPEGKAVVAQNAVKHGLLAQQAVIPGEDPGQFETYRDQMLAELAPEGQMESMLADRAVSLAWRLLRAQRLQNEAFDHLYTKDTTSPLRHLPRSPYTPKEKPAPTGEAILSEVEGPARDPALGRIVVKDFANSRVLDRLLMYERRLEHSLYRTTTELQRLRLLRAAVLSEVEESAPTEPEHSTAPIPPDRAKQTQLPSNRKPTKRLMHRYLEPIQPARPPRKQTQSNPIEARPRGEFRLPPARPAVCSLPSATLMG